MKDNRTETNAGSQTLPPLEDGFELALARAVRELEPTLPPSRNLWPGIERRIVDHPQRQPATWQRHWLSFGVAASLLMAASALTLALLDLRQPAGQLLTSTPAMERLQLDYQQVSNPMLASFTEANKDLAPATLEVLYRNLDLLAAARRDIEEQVRAHPEDSRLVTKLIQIHEQELTLLKQDYMAQGLSM
jgi:hypothetical protein